MRKKLTVVIIFLLLFQSTAYGTPPFAKPSAIDIYNQVYALRPGENIKVALNLLGFPQDRFEQAGDIPPSFHWYSAPNREITIYFHDNSTIETVTYTETYEQIVQAQKRYEELKGDFHEILGTPHVERGSGTAWRVEEFMLALAHNETYNSDALIKFGVDVHFTQRRGQ